MLPVETSDVGGRRKRRAPVKAAAAVAALLATGLYATTASAGCGGGFARAPAVLEIGAPGATLTKATLPGFPLNLFNSIVGMWSVTFTDSMGALNDYGYQQWHSDGTEILNSATHSPATENFCLGVWKEAGHDHYLLNHFALSYDTGATTPSVKINIKEDVSVDASGDSFKGTFSEDVVAVSSGSQIAHITGTVTGQRIKVDS